MKEIRYMSMNYIIKSNSKRDSSNKIFKLIQHKNQFKKMIVQIKTCRLFVYALFIGISLINLTCSVKGISATSEVSPEKNMPALAEHKQEIDVVDKIPLNHKVEEFENFSLSNDIKQTTRRKSRQYDSTISAASSNGGNYPSIPGDTGSYIGQYSTPTNYASAASNVAASNYQNDLSGTNYHTGTNYHDLLAVARGFTSTPTMMAHSPVHHYANSASLTPGYPSMSPPIFPTASTTSGPLASFSSSMFPLMSKGFDISEIVCTAIAVAIGAVIVGAPFILIYLFIMNHMNGNNGAIGPNGGSISLTGPTSSTTVSGRKKRHTSLQEALFKQLSPLVNNEQVAQTFKALMSSIAKYQH